MSGNILVVEDDKDLRELLHLALEDAGYTVRTAVDGLVALTALETWTPDVIVSDVMMPEMSGLDLLQELEKRGIRERYKVILMTAFTNYEDGIRKSDCEIILKPFYLEILYDVLTKLLPELPA